MNFLSEDFFNQSGWEQLKPKLDYGEEHIRAFFNLIPVGMAQIDITTRRLKRVNAALCEILGYGETELQKLTVDDITHPEEREPDRQLYFNQLYGETTRYESEKRYLHKDGYTVWGAATVKIVRSPQGQPLYVLKIIQDISKNKQTEEALRLSEALFRQVPENIDEVFWIVSFPEHQMLYISPVYERVWGRTCLSLYQDPYSFLDSIHPEDKSRFIAWLGDLSSRIGQDIKYRIIRPDGSIRWIWDRAFPVRDFSGNIYRVTGISTDITERKEAEEKLRQNQFLLVEAQRVARLGNWAHDLTTQKITWTEQLFHLLNLDPALGEPKFEELVGLYLPEDGEKLNQAVERIIKTGESYRLTLRLPLEDGSIRYIEALGHAEFNAEGEVIRLYGTAQDITERKQAEKQIQYLAYYDSLTDLPNRRLLFDRIESALSLAKRRRKYGALLFIDLDRFKIVNDARGHEIGDQLLKQVAMRLKGSVRKTDTVARFGGDEFVVLFPELSNWEKVASSLSISFGRKICSLLARPFLFEGEKIIIGASIGITLFPSKTETVKDLLRQADMAMYQAKASGRNRIHLFERQMQIEVESRFALERELRRALEQNQFRVYLQPQVNSEGSLVGAEALLRWEHPGRGLVLPSDFIPVAEETGLIVEMDKWLLTQICNHLHHLQSPFQIPHLSVNISPHQFRQVDFVNTIKSILTSHDVEPGHFTIEVTEGLIIEDFHQASSKMSELQALGINFSIDDFGTGYSSLAYLKRLPLNELKIDKSFVQDAPTDPNDSALVAVIIDIASHFNLRVIAEGVETLEQAKFLKARGCKFFQGYLYGKPSPMSEFTSIWGSGKN